MTDEMKAKRDELIEHLLKLKAAGLLEKMGYDGVKGFTEGINAGYEMAWSTREEPGYYLHTDDCYYWTPSAWAEYQKLRNDKIATTNTGWPHEKKLHEIIERQKKQLEILRAAIVKIPCSLIHEKCVPCSAIAEADAIGRAE